MCAATAARPDGSAERSARKSLYLAVRRILGSTDGQEDASIYAIGMGRPGQAQALRLLDLAIARIEGPDLDDEAMNLDEALALDEKLRAERQAGRTDEPPESMMRQTPLRITVPSGGASHFQGGKDPRELEDGTWREDLMVHATSVGVVRPLSAEDGAAPARIGGADHTASGSEADGLGAGARSGRHEWPSYLEALAPKTQPVTGVGERPPRTSEGDPHGSRKRRGIGRPALLWPMGG